MKKSFYFLIIIVLIFALTLPFILQKPARKATLRALLISNDVFKTKDSLSPSGKTNAALIEEILLADERKYSAINKISNVPLSEEDFSNEIQRNFSKAGSRDISVLYISSHGFLNEDDSFSFYTSDGKTESLISAECLLKSLSKIKGTKLIIVDACNSGALIGKGLGLLSLDSFYARLKKSGLYNSFASKNIKFIVSAGAYEASYIWTSSRAKEGSSHFALALFNALSEKSSFKADYNRDGKIQMSELESYLKSSFGLSTPYAYPTNDDFVLLSYKRPAPKASLTVSDFDIENRYFSKKSMDVSFSYRLNQPAKIGYQLIYQGFDGWNFRKTQLILASELDENADSPGFKEVTLKIDDIKDELHGFIQLQIVEVEGKKLRPLNGSLLTVLSPKYEEPYMEVPQTQRISDELPIALFYPAPFRFKLNILNERGETVLSPFSDELTRPHNSIQEGMLLYCALADKSGKRLPPGTYRVELIVQTENQGQKRILSEKIRFTD